MEKSLILQQVTRKIGGCLLLGGMVWVLLLIMGALALRDKAGDATYNVVLGPLVLNRISRHEIGDGFVASFSFESGLWWYVFYWLLFGVLLGITSALFRNNNQER